MPGASLGSFAGVADGLLQAVFCPTALPFAMLTAQAVLKGSLSQKWLWRLCLHVPRLVVFSSSSSAGPSSSCSGPSAVSEAPLQTPPSQTHRGPPAKTPLEDPGGFVSGFFLGGRWLVSGISPGPPNRKSDTDPPRENCTQSRKKKRPTEKSARNPPPNR